MEWKWKYLAVTKPKCQFRTNSDVRASRYLIFT